MDDTATVAQIVEHDDHDEHDDDGVVEEELLVEEVSIDGMCGVY